jgi:secretion/DNA translocation related TadE-like protein
VLIVAVVVAGSGLLGVARAVAAGTRHRAAAAADAAALTAAAHGLDGASQACQAAARVAAADGAVVTSCVLSGGVATVRATARAPGWLHVLGSASGVARAGQIRADHEEPRQAGLAS